MYDSNHFATGGSTSPDWDPEHPYHYHTSTGEKIAVSEEDWNKYKDDPAFKKVRTAIEAEQTAHPNPEYEINKKQLKDFVDSYKHQSAYHSIINYKNFGESLPEGYSFTEEGLIKDKDGNLYGQAKYKDSPRFSLDRTKPFQYVFMPNKPVEQTVTFYPANIEKSIKQPQAVTRYLNVGKKKEKVVNNYIRNNNKKYLPPISFVTQEDTSSPFGSIVVNKDNTVSFNTHDRIGRKELENDLRDLYENANLNDSINAKEYNRQVDLINDFISHEEWFPGIYWDNLIHVDTVTPKQKALKNAVIEVEEPAL